MGGQLAVDPPLVLPLVFQVFPLKLTSLTSTTTATDPSRRSLYHVPPIAMPWPSKMPPPATTVAMGLRWRAGNDSPYHARKVPAVAKPCL